MSFLGRGLRRAAPWVMFVAALRRDSDDAAWVSPKWLHHRQSLRLVERTFPAAWTSSTRWSVEVEEDGRNVHGWISTRTVAEYRVLALDDGLALVDVAGVANPPRFLWDTQSFGLHALPRNEYRPPETIAESGYGWKRVEEEEELPWCFHRFTPWEAPLLRRATSVGDVLDVLGDRWVDGVHQRAWVEDGMVRFEIGPSNARHEIVSIVWRPGDPWWAKIECFVPGRTEVPPSTWEHQRGARARLVAIDGVPVEPLPWEHPPHDWMAGRPRP